MLADLHIVTAPDRTVRYVLACPAGGRPTAVPSTDYDRPPYAAILAALASIAPDAQTTVIENVRYRLEHFATVAGHAWTLVPSAEPPPLPSLDLPGPTMELLTAIGGQRGLVLMTGNYGAGKTILRCALMRHWLEIYGGRALEWADPPEYLMDGPWGKGHCHQMEIDHDQYAVAAHKTKRSRAQYVGFSECRSPQSYAAVLDAALSGPLVITTIPSPTPVTGIAAYLAAASRIDTYAATNLAARLTAILHVSLYPKTDDRYALTVDPIILSEDPAAIERTLIRNGDLIGLGAQWRRSDPSW
ncbi:MAG: hypothetical protein M0006_15885 [Magnetospirillum sp.]|nr:hypothetical protein [Magnetospirillum sp.]